MKQKDELGIVTEAAERRKKYARFLKEKPPADKIPDRYITERRVIELIREQGPMVLMSVSSLDIRREISTIINEELTKEVRSMTLRIIQNRRSRGLMPQKGPPLDVILAAVIEATGTTPKALSSISRTRVNAWPRHLANWLIRELREDMSLTMIGMAMGARDHTTIVHSLRSFEMRRGAEPFRTWLEHPAIVKLLKERQPT